jgi:hypothetical protein
MWIGRESVSLQVFGCQTSAGRDPRLWKSRGESSEKVVGCGLGRFGLFPVGDTCLRIAVFDLN